MVDDGDTNRDVAQSSGGEQPRKPSAHDHDHDMWCSSFHGRIELRTDKLQRAYPMRLITPLTGIRTVPAHEVR